MANTDGKIKMFLNISLVVVVGMAMLFLCDATCERYYVIMEKYTDGLQESYRPINKYNNTWSISKIHNNNETHKFDMNCVLNLHCDQSITQLINHIPIVPRVGHDDTYNDTTTVTNIDKDAGLSFGANSDLETVQNNSDSKTKTKNSNSSVEDTQINIGINNALTDTSSVESTEFTVTENTVTTETIASSTSPKNSKEDESVGNNKESSIYVNHNLNTSIENTSETDNTDKIEAFPQNTTKLLTVDPNITKNIDVNTKDNMTLAGNASNETSINGIGYHKYNPEESKTLATKVLAGLLGALAAVAVCVLVKAGVTKLIAYITQVGVYRLPDI